MTGSKKSTASRYAVFHQSLNLDNETLTNICSGFNNDISGCLSFLDLISAQCKNRGSKSDILSVLKSSQTVETLNKGYYEVIRAVFNKTQNSALFKAGET